MMTMPSDDFRIQLDAYRGPIDLLLYLVRRHEVDLRDIPVAQIAEQYLEFMDVIEQLDMNLVGDFLEVASLLVEAKMRALLPRPESDSGDDLEDPRDHLVERLLLYKQFKDASLLLEEQQRQWQDRYGRVANDLPPRQLDVAEQPIKEVELWDLVSSFGRILRTNQPAPGENIVYDDTPIHVYMQRIHQRLVGDHQISFSELFEIGMHKSAMVGVFLAILELVRHHDVTTEQPDEHGDILILPGKEFQSDLKISEDLSF